MSNSKQENRPNVPALRFPGFTDEWKKMTINAIANVIGGGTPDTTNTNYWEGDIQWFTPSEVGKSKYVTNSVRQISKLGLIKSSAKILPPASILLSTRATVGECSINTNQCATNQGFQSLIPKAVTTTDFLYYLIQTRKNELIKKASGSTFLEISANEVRKLPIYIPSKKEQDKIASFLSLLDERIAIQNKIIEDLKKLKSAIIDKVFCLPTEKRPHKRLGNFFDDWKIVRLSEICNRITEKNSGLKCNLVLTIAAQYGLVSQLDFFNKNIASENLSSYFLIKNGDFAYNKSYSGDYPWGAIKKLDYYEAGILSPLYFCFRSNPDNVNSDFLAFYFESKKWHRGISEIAGEGARNHGLLNISVVDFFDTLHRIPSLKEQLHIVTILQSYQNKIINEERLLFLFHNQRKYLLSQLFI